MPELKIQERVVTFFDILGFTKLTELAKTDPERAARTAQKIEAAFHQIHKDHKDLEDLGTRITMFSDNVCISDPFDARVEYLADNLYHLVWSLRFIQADMVVAGYFIRGGVAVGPHYQSDYTIFGPALVDAYRTESKVSVVPRIVVHPSYLSALRRATPTLGAYKVGYINGCLRRDVDGHMFVDYLGCANEFDYEEEVIELFTTHKNAILEQVGQNVGTLEVVNKYYWAATYHNAKAMEVLGAQAKDFTIDMDATFPAKAKNPVVKQ